MVYRETAEQETAKQIARPSAVTGSERETDKRRPGARNLLRRLTVDEVALDVVGALVDDGNPNVAVDP